jgi:hypothetical protein
MHVLALRRIHEITRAEFDLGIAITPPIFWLVIIILERTVAHHLAPQTAIGSMIYLLKEDAIWFLGKACAILVREQIQLHLCLHKY